MGFSRINTELPEFCRFAVEREFILLSITKIDLFINRKTGRYNNCIKGEQDYCKSLTRLLQDDTVGI